MIYQKTPGMGLIVVCCVIIQLFACALKEDRLKELLKAEITQLYPQAKIEIVEAFLTIDRRYLLDNISSDELYKNKTHPLPNKQVASQPLINILLAQELEINQGTTILEIGTGSGIQAALFSKLGAKVYSMEINFALMATTKDRLYKAGYRNIEMRHGDGFYGWPGTSVRFDRIVLTCSYHRVPPALIRQLKNNGLLIMPLGPRNTRQKLVRYKKKANTLVIDKIIRNVAFVPLLQH